MVKCPQWFRDDSTELKHNADLAYFNKEYLTAADLYEKVLRGNKGKGVFQTASQTDDLSRALLKAGRTSEALHWANKLVNAECKA